MRHSVDRDTLPAILLAVVLVFSGLTSALGSTPDPSGEKGRRKPTQTQRTQTRPAQTRPSRSPAKPGAKPKPAQKPMSFTNEDLKRFHDGAPAATTARQNANAKAPASEDPLKPYRDQEERARWKKEKAARIQEHVLDLEARLRKLEQKRLSIENPYVPRPPAQEGDSSDAGLSGPELLQRTDAEIKEATDQLEAARKELAASLETTP